MAEETEEHAAILRAIREGNPDRAAQATAAHLDNTLEDYRHEIQRRLSADHAAHPPVLRRWW